MERGDGDDRVIICASCGQGQGAAFAARLGARIPGQVEVRTVDCLNVCDRPVALALRGRGKDVYLFSGVDPESDLDDAVALARLYQEAPTGVIEDARPAGRLRYCLVGRVPG